MTAGNFTLGHSDQLMPASGRVEPTWASWDYSGLKDDRLKD